MNRTTRLGLSVAALFAVMASFAPTPTYAQGLGLSLVETGAEPNTSVSLFVQGFGSTLSETDRLVAPSGDVFTNNAQFIIFPGTLLKSFSSLSDALNYVQGAWEKTSVPRFGTPPAPLDFTINPISLGTINRAAPEVLSPQPGAVIKNGTAFSFAWDYATNGGPLPTRSLATVMPRFTNDSALHTFLVNTPGSGPPPSGGSGSTGTGDDLFQSSLSLAPGATDSHYLLRLTAATAALPLNAQITLGSYISLNDAIPNDNAGSQFPFLVPVQFYYSRQVAPFDITLSSVPEPSAIGLLACVVFGAVTARWRK